VDYAPETAAGFAVGFPLPAADVLLVGEEGGDPHVVRDLAARDARCSELPVTRLTTDDRAPLPPIGQFDGIALASSNTARRLLEAYPAGSVEGQMVISIGPMTSRTAEGLGLRVDAQAPTASPVAVVRLLIERLGAAPPPGREENPSRDPGGGGIV
jgi:uroporphyrinogen-III synthase